jgi:flagellar basal-body rod protein FlgB
MLDRMTESIDFHGKALQLRAQRQEVLSSNIANADTPGFKARDFDFSTALRSATTAPAAPGGSSAAATGMSASTAAAPAVGIVQSTAALDTARSQPGHLPSGGAGDGVVSTSRLQYTSPEQASLDGNTVDMNRERAAFADNSLRYEATLRFINGRVRTMMTAIRGE